MPEAVSVDTLLGSANLWGCSKALEYSFGMFTPLEWC